MNSENKNNKYKIEEYIKIGKIGCGAFGTVYKLQKGKYYYALKQIPINNMTKEIIDKFIDEAKILSKFDSKYIVKYYTSFIEGGYFNKIMEYGGDLNLKQFIKEYKGNEQLIEENIIEYIIKQICFGLEEIHEANLIHRDLSPDNIFINQYYKIKIGDFGVSKKLSTHTKFAKTKTGKQHYNAPEIEKGEEYDQRVDIYALGCIIYELFTLNEYFIDKLDEKSCKINTEIYSPKWQELLDLLLQKNYLKRPNIHQINEKINSTKNIKILIVNSQNIRTEINCNLNMKVKELRHKYLNIVNMNNKIDDFVVHFDGEILEDDKTLEYYDIEDGSCLIAFVNFSKKED